MGLGRSVPILIFIPYTRTYVHKYLLICCAIDSIQTMVVPYTLIKFREFLIMVVKYEKKTNMDVMKISLCLQSLSVAISFGFILSNQTVCGWISFVPVLHLV